MTIILNKILLIFNKFKINTCIYLNNNKIKISKIICNLIQTYKILIKTYKIIIIINFSQIKCFNNNNQINNFNFNYLSNSND